MSITIERGKIDEILNHLTIQILKSADAGQIMDAQRVAGNKIADMIFDAASTRFDRIMDSIEEDKKEIRGQVENTVSDLTKKKFQSRIDGLDLAIMRIHNTD